MTISIPGLTVSFASHLPDDVTDIHVIRTGEGLVLFHVAKGDLTVNHVESETAIELSRGNVGIAVAEKVHALLRRVRTPTVLGLSHDRP